MTNLVKTLDNAMHQLKDVKKQINIPRLSTLESTVIDCVVQDALCKYDWLIDSSADIFHKGELIGEANYSASKELINGYASGDYDSPNDPDEIKIILNSISVEIYSQKGWLSENVTKALNVILNENVGFDLLT